jgi:5-methylcytosine-specific restriction endonuclease McrA
MIIICIVSFIVAFNMLIRILEWSTKCEEERRERERAQEEQNWRSSVEPIYRVHETYPPDWERRRALVFIRDKGCCSQCRAKIGKLLCDAEKVFGVSSVQRLVKGADIHHEKPISMGGTHELENLKLICLACHAMEHPKNENLRKRAWRKKNKRLRILKRQLSSTVMNNRNNTSYEDDEEIPF